MSVRHSYGYQSVVDDADGNYERPEDLEDIGDIDDSQLFSQSDAYHDFPFSLVFIVQLAIVMLTALLSLFGDYEAPNPSLGLFDYEQRAEVFEMFAVCLLIGLIVSLIWIMTILAFTHYLVAIVTLALLLVSVTVTITLLITGPLWFTAVFLAIAFATVMSFMSLRSWGSFSSSLLHLVLGIIRLYPATIAVALALNIIQCGWLALWCRLALSLMLKGQTISTFWMSLLTLSLLWGLSVMKHTVHTIVAGVVSTWYFMHETGLPNNPTLRSLQKSLSTSFGSVCMAALIVPWLQLLRSTLASLRRLQIPGIHPFIALSSRAVDCAASYANVFALTQTTMYNKPFLQASKDSWNLIRMRGVELVIAHDASSPAVTIISWLSGTFTALCGGLWANQQEELDVGVVVTLCFLAGYAVVQVMMEVVDSAITALFVCYAEDPEILSRCDPIVFSKIREGCSVDADGS